MWDKRLDEGIFLCDHNQDFTTAEFSESLSYIEAQSWDKSWKVPNQLLHNKCDLVAKILLKNSKHLRELVSCTNIPLSNKRQNDLFQGELGSKEDHYKDQLFIYELFHPEAIYESECAT